jgi:hypothetical protein
VPKPVLGGWHIKYPSNGTGLPSASEFAGTPDAMLARDGVAKYWSVRMKYTGLILAIIGLIAGIVCMVVLLNPTAPGRDAPATNDTTMQRPNMIVPLAVCGACVVIGAGMYVYGGRSYVTSNNPHVRN